MRASEVVIIARPIVIGPPRVSRYLLLWPLFFLICFGLGFPTLARYNPKDALGDTKAYYKLVTGVSTPEFADYSQRLLVPYVAQPFYRLARGRVGSWDPVLFGLLVSNSLFLAGTAFLLVNIGCEVLGDYVSALLGALLYLLNFSVAN